MDDPIERLRKRFQEQQALNELQQFAQKCEADLIDESWKQFVQNVLLPAFTRVEKEVFVQKYEPLYVRTEPGFKVKDKPESEFWFWVEFNGRALIPHAGRKYGRT